MNIRKIRKAREWTFEELGERAGLHYTFIGGVELGRRNVSLNTLGKLVRALGVAPADLFRDAPQLLIRDASGPYLPGAIEDTLVRISQRLPRQHRLKDRPPREPPASQAPALRGL